MIEAAHLRGDADGGSPDARNGLPVNAALHRAFDAHLFAIHPDTLAVEVRLQGPSLDEPGIIHLRLNFPRPPGRTCLAVQGVAEPHRSFCLTLSGPESPLCCYLFVT